MSTTAFRPSRHSTRPIRVSFEFFPPKTAEMEATLWSSIERLAPLGPSFVSVTYGAGGSTRERTHNTVARILRDAGREFDEHLPPVIEGAQRPPRRIVALDPIPEIECADIDAERDGRRLIGGGVLPAQRDELILRIGPGDRRHIGLLGRA